MPHVCVRPICPDERLASGQRAMRRVKVFLPAFAGCVALFDGMSGWPSSRMGHPAVPCRSTACSATLYFPRLHEESGPHRGRQGKAGSGWKPVAGFRRLPRHGPGPPSPVRRLPAGRPVPASGPPARSACGDGWACGCHPGTCGRRRPATSAGTRSRHRSARPGWPR